MSYLVEKWKDVVGYEGLYLVSNYGNVYAITRTLVSVTGRKYCKEGRLLPHSINGLGYVIFSIVDKDFRRKTVYGHRLVADAFINNPDNKTQVNHKNGVRCENYVCNLEWVTPKENIGHAINTGSFKQHINLGNSKRRLSDEDVKDIRCGDESLDDLAVKYNVGKKYISKILRNKSRV